jgi:hypothetical protein
MTQTPQENNQQRHAPRQELTPRDLADAGRLLSEIARLHTELSASRMRAANLEAAIRAALGAAGDGESNPLSYLRDEAGSPDGAHGA